MVFFQKSPTALWATGMLLVFSFLVLAGSSTKQVDAIGQPLVLPFAVGETWYVCQGYNGSISHTGQPSLDLSISSQSIGPNGCTPATNNASTGKSVSAPVSGTAYQVSSDFVCINANGGGSVLVGHLGSRIASGSAVVAGQTVIGSVNAPGLGNNGDYAHIHLQAHISAGCGTSAKIAFDDAHAARFQCAPDLSYSGAANQWSGTSLTRCSSGAAPAAPSNVSVSNPTSASLQLNFKDNAANETRIYIERKLSGNAWESQGYFNALSGTSSWYWVNTGLSASSTYCYRLRAYNDSGYSSYSGEACGTTSSNSQTRTEVVVEETSGGFQRGGQYWWDSAIGSGGHSLWTYVNGSSVSSWGEWTANLAGGNYEVYIWVPRTNATTQSARYEIRCQTGTVTKVINQNAFYDQWVSAGTCSFSSGSAVRVRLTDATGESSTSSRMINFDAIKLVPR